MKIHYFQRYHTKENVATANTMLLLSRLYSYSSEKFYRLLKSEFFADTFEPELVFTLQEKSVNSIPDATITQESFKIVVETKLSDWFYSTQLMNHLNSFSEEKFKILLTLAPEPMDKQKKIDVDNQIKNYNKSLLHPIIHINTTFEKIANAIQDIIDDRDYEMKDVLDDYLNYCYNDNLIPIADSWKYMRMQLASTTFEFNVSENIYYDKADRGFRAHDYLGLYKNKSVRAIGKINAIITAVEKDGELVYKVEKGNLTEDKKNKIIKAIKNGDDNNYDLHTIEHRYFFVEQFFETDFKKITPRPPMGTRIFDLTNVLSQTYLPQTNDIAEKLKTVTWE